MSSEITSSSHARRNRMIAILAGAVTVVAIVLGFAGDVLGLPWHWMRPAAELLLLAELVGLVVLERHQLFEPVHETVSGMNSRLGDLQLSIAALTRDFRARGHVAFFSSPAEVLRALTRVTHAALARDQEGPQILRLMALSGLIFAQDDREAARELEEYAPAFFSYFVTKASAVDSRARRWSVRLLAGAASVASFDRMRELITQIFAQETLNVEIKIFVKPRAESLLSPQTITDQNVVLVFDDVTAAFRWGLVLEGSQYTAPFARWFDDLWANLPNTRLICSRGGINQNALDLIRKELEAVEAAQAQQTV